MAAPVDQNLRIEVISRRTFLVSAATAAALMPAFLAAAQETPPQTLERTAHFKEAYEALLAGAAPMEGKVTLELPEIAENGNFVPLTVSVDHPMTYDDYIKTIHILSTSNPVARVATFHLSPINGIAKVQSRIRLAKTQDVIALAQTSEGLLAIATTLVKVTIGGCSS